MVSENNHSPSINSGLAQVLWRRYTVTPSTMQRLAILRPIQSMTDWSIARAPLLNDVQKRWLPTEPTMGQGSPLELSFAGFASSVSNVRENALVQRKLFSPQDDRSPGPVFEVPRPERRVSEQAMIPHETTASYGSTVPAAKHETASPLVQLHSPVMAPRVQRKVFPEQVDQPQAPMDGVDLSPRREEALPAIEPVQNKSFAPDTSAAHNDSLAIHVLRRHLEMPITQMVQRKIPVATDGRSPLPAPVADLPRGKMNLPAGTQPSGPSDVLQSVAPVNPLPIVHVLQRQPDSSLPLGTSIRSGLTTESTLVNNRSDISIQRSATFAAHSQGMPPQLPLAQPVQINVAASRPDGFIQMSRSSISAVNSHQPLPVHLIQRQSEPGESPATAASSNAPAVASPPVPGNNPVGAVDIEKIADQVMRIILRQMTVERERRGIGR